MPNYENNNIKGDLYITFDIAFPRGGLEDNDKEGWYKSSISWLFQPLIINNVLLFNDELFTFIFLSALKNILKQSPNQKAYNGL